MSSSSSSSSSSSTGGTQATKTFQHGVDGYAGGVSFDISDGNFGPVGQYGENGTTYGDGHADHCMGYLHSTLGYDISPLIRFENLDLPVGASVISATLTVTFVVWNGSPQVLGRYLKVPWTSDVQDPNGGTTTAPLGWRYRMAGVAWSGLGATGEDTDVMATPQFVFTGLTANGEQTMTTSLDPAVVQTWVTQPSANHGFKLQANASATGIHIGFVQNQRDPSGRPAITHPKLTIVYVVP